jgi:DNA-binding Lrp family transcriptional regulator
MDDIDRQLIGLLRSNARASAASLAKTLKVARGTVQNRLAKLERDGTIAGYTIRVRPTVDDQVLSRIRRIEGISGTETSLLLSTLKL